MNKGVFKAEQDEQWKFLVLLFKNIAKEKGLTPYKLAKDIGSSDKNHVKRIFNLEYCPNLKTVVKLVNAIGVNIFFKGQDDPSLMNQAFENAMVEFGRRTNKLPNN